MQKTSLLTHNNGCKWCCSTESVSHAKHGRSVFALDDIWPGKPVPFPSVFSPVHIAAVLCGVPGLFVRVARRACCSHSHYADTGMYRWWIIRWQQQQQPQQLWTSLTFILCAGSNQCRMERAPPGGSENGATVPPTVAITVSPDREPLRQDWKSVCLHDKGRNEAWTTCQSIHQLPKPVSDAHTTAQFCSTKLSECMFVTHSGNLLLDL